MPDITPPAITTLDTPLGPVAVHLQGPADGEPIVFVHGNLSDGPVWYEQMAALPEGYRGIAVDCRGFGLTPPRPVDATRGLGDLADDVHAAMVALDLGQAHLVGHSMGGGTVLHLAIDHPELVRSLVLVAPVSPYGYGATHADGRPTSPDFAGSGGGGANPELVRRMAEDDRSADDPASPRSVIRSLFFPTPADVRDEELILDGMLRSATGEDNYPGDHEPSDNWPGIAPGRRGILNALTPRWCDLTGIVGAVRVPLLWVRGDTDLIIGEHAMTDFGTLGAEGIVPGWPGEDAHPPQAMVTQTRQVLEDYAAAGGGYREVVLEATGHFPFTQHPAAFATLLAEHLDGVR